MKITKASDYAIKALAYMSQDPKAKYLRHKLAKDCDIPDYFLARILQGLAKAGLLQSERGARGGFFLLKPPAEITLLDVIVAVDGKISLLDCTGADGCKKMGNCVAASAWMDIQKDFEALLNAKTVESIAEGFFFDTNDKGHCISRGH